MSPLSAISAIGPAIERTKLYLFKPFRLGRFLKLALVACLAESSYSGLNLNFNTPFPSSGNHPPFEFPHIHWPSASVWFAIAAVTVLVFVPVSIFVNYLLIRLRFSYFDCVLDGHDKITPGWRKYHRQALRYLGVSLAIGLAFFVALVSIGLAVWWNYREIFADLVSGNRDRIQVDFLSLLPAMLLTFCALFFLALAGFLIQMLMNYCVLPRMALEDASISRAFSGSWSDLRAERGQFALFLLMRILLPMVAGFVAVMVLLIPTVIFGVIVGSMGAMVHNAVGSIPWLSFVLLAALAFLIVMPMLVLAGIAVGGTVGTFTRNYGLLFYAGRYPQLAARLRPPLPISNSPIG